MAKSRLGKLPPRYSFALNQYREWRCSTCPKCEQPTRLRKFALLIGIEDLGMIVLGKTCRFCPRCDFIILHQDELEHLLQTGMERAGLTLGEYLVIGTVERKTWRSGLRTALPPDEVLDHAADFKKVFDLHYQPAGWYREGE